MRHKARIQLSLIINVGISIISCPPILKHQKKISTMAEPNAGRDGRLWDEWPPHPREPLIRDGLVKVAVEGFVYIL